jgi:hypothetical protein
MTPTPALHGDVVVGPVTIEGRDRYVLFMPHPSQPVSLQRIPERLSAAQLREVLDFMRSRRFIWDGNDLTFEQQPDSTE